jgi:hypothetical protein
VVELLGWAWVAAIALGIRVTVLSAVIPARQAACITLEAMRPQIAEVEDGKRSRWVYVGAAPIAHPCCFR